MTGSPDTTSEVPRLHILVDGKRAENLDAVRRVGGAVGSDVAFQLRGSGLGGARLLEVALLLKEICGHTGSRLIINDRVDVALAARADGAHLKALSMPPAAARRVLGAGPLLGRSIHAPDEIVGEAEVFLDYWLLGSVFPTASHPGDPALPREAPRAAVAAARLPVLAIGGVTPANLSGLLNAGIHGAFVLRGVWEATSPPAAVSAYLQVLSRGAT